jgi:transcriptional regulator with PAS, ATPase and Fis domain
VGSELFGYEDGAFTGASKGGKPGKFELASGDTLFLDEIGDMPLEHQAVLLRVIQEKRMTRIGGLKVIPVDVRLICATHKNLLERVRKGTFRQDLYYRLNVMSITIPPLRERTEDIPQLFRHFLDKLCRDRGARLTVDKDLMHYLYSYPWPGNVRELQNVIERAVVLCQGPMITQADLPAELRGQFSAVRNSSLQFVGIDPALPLAEAVEVFKRTRIQAVLESVSGNQTQAAQLLGLPRSNLSRLMKRLRLRR